MPDGSVTHVSEQLLPISPVYTLIVVACTIIVYSQATFTAPMAQAMSYPYLILTTPLVVFALFRHLFLIIQNEESGDIADIIFQDRPLLATIVSWATMVLMIKISLMVRG